MMIAIRRGADRGHFDYGWLDTWHTFSFGDYHDPEQMGFRALRVLNEDFVAPGAGFPRHPHRDMEIVTLVLEGAIEHQDSMGNRTVIRPGEVQRMTAGTGVVHSEANPSKTERLHLLQIWILPEREGLQPDYEQKPFPKGGLVASRDGRDGSLTIHQDVEVWLARGAFELKLRPGREAWVQVLRGDATVNGRAVKAGDGAAMSGERVLRIEGDVLILDLA